jgi:CHC2 zinc finger
MTDKPDIVRVIEERGIELRKAGKEFLGGCPFHADKSPSFSVNQEKGLFHCFACGESGDVFDFIMRLDGCSFAEAAKSLGVNTDKPMRRHEPSAEAVAVTNWANGQFLRAQSLLREINQKLRLAQELSWQEEIDRLVREFQILSILSDDLQTPKYAITLHRDPEQKLWVENLLSDAPQKEPPPEFPALTTGYMAHRKEIVN